MSMAYPYDGASARSKGDSPTARVHSQKTQECGGIRFTERLCSSDVQLTIGSETGPTVLAVLGGSLRTSAGGETKTLDSSTLVFLPRGASREAISASPRTSVISCELSASATETLEPLPECLRQLTVIKGGELLVLAHRLHRELMVFDEQSPLALRGLLLEMISRAARLEAAKRHPRPPRCLERATEVITERFGETLRLTEIAEIAGVHHVYLARVFRRYHGCSVGEFIRRTRIDWAAEQLRTVGKTVAEIALEAGFADQSHFTRVFKSLTGTTPARYRMELRRDRARERSLG